MRRIIIHLGPHKTGTTAFQYQIRTRKPLSEYSVLYPDAGNIFSGHHNLVWERSLSSRYVPNRGGWRDLIREVEADEERRPVLLSSEEFSVCEASIFADIRELLRGYAIELLYVLRDPRDLIRSNHAEESKNGVSIASLEEYAGSLVDYDRRVNFAPFLKQVARLLDATSTHVYFYDTHILSRLFQHVGLEVLLPFANEKRNPTLDQETLGQIIALRTKHIHDPWYRFFVEHVGPRLTGRRPFPHGLVKPQHFELSDALSSRLLHRYNANLSELRNCPDVILHE